MPGVEKDTSLQQRAPCRAKLQIDKPSTWSKAVEIGYSPARDLIQNHVGMGFSIVCRMAEGQGLAFDDE
jgi:hypothetical protein